MKNIKNQAGFVVVLVAGLSVAGGVLAEGNRYDLPRAYHSDVSASSAYLNLFHGARGDVKVKGKEPVMIDVRDVSEYAAGHVEKAFSIPFPHIFSRPGRDDYIAQDPAVFVAAVMEKIQDKNTPIYTLCRTGFRSVLAANLLADAGYTQVRNVWEGFVGNTKVDVSGNVLDLNNNGIVDDADLDGWSNAAGLPVDYALEDELLYSPYYYLY
jgi:rhodanese-related sulfurtransferase